MRSKATTNCSVVLARMTPRLAERLSGLSTHGNSTPRAASTGFSPSAMRRKRGTGTPAAARHCRIWNLSRAVATAAGALARRPSRSAMAAAAAVTSSTPATPASGRSTLHVATMAAADSGSAAAIVATWSVERPLAGVAGVDDVTAAAAAIAERLGLRASAPAAVATARDKFQMRQCLAAAGVPVPRFRRIALGENPVLAARGVEFPCVLKPLSLSASRGVIRANTTEQFVVAFKRIAALLARDDVTVSGDAARYLLAEEYVPGLEVALEGLLIGGTLHVLALFDKPDPLEGPFFEETIYVTPSRLPEAVQRAIRDTTAAACAGLGLTEGPVHAELRVNDDGPWVLEVAARSIGGLCSRTLRFGTGMTLEEIILRHALGWSIATLERERPAAGVMMIPTPRAGVLKEVQGLDAAKATRHIEDVEIGRAH